MKKHLIKILAITLVISAIAFKFLESKSPLELVPEELGASKILYTKEEAWGFGPGGNETGIHVYELPEDAFQKIQAQGIEYFKNLPSNTNGEGDWIGHYQDWKETPIKVSQYWTDYMSLGDNADYSKQIPSVYHYMNAYGFGLEIDPQIQKLVDDAITVKGNYYSYGRIGFILIIPEKRRIIYVYNG